MHVRHIFSNLHVEGLQHWKNEMILVPFVGGFE